MLGGGTGKGFHIPPKLSRRRVFLCERCGRDITYRQAKVMLCVLLTYGQHVRCECEASRHDAIEIKRQRQLDDNASSSEPWLPGPNRPVRAKERGALSSG